MSTFYYAVNSAGDYIFDNVPSELMHLVANYGERHEPHEVIINDVKKIVRIGRKVNNSGIIYIITDEKKYLNRYKLFKEHMEISSSALKPLADFQNKIIHETNAQTEEFIHNVTSLNTYSIQDLFTLIPQNILTENINKQTDAIRTILNEKPNVAVKTFLKLIKYNLAMKVEFSVFERMLKPHAVVQKMNHSIRQIILSILQIFIEDFESMKIEVSLAACEKRVSVDYDSLFVSLYYLLDNAVKYCCPSTDFKIVFKEEQNSFSILFIMISLKIEDNEVDKLSVRGFRSDLAKKLDSTGNGIGMYRILKTLKLNNAELEVIPRTNGYKTKRNGFEYEGNQFKIKLIGQQDWCKTT